jgi:hypothetical protein
MHEKLAPSDKTLMHALHPIAPLVHDAEARPRPVLPRFRGHQPKLEFC